MGLRGLCCDNLKWALKWGVETGLTAENPIQLMKRLPETPEHQRYRRRAMSEEEIRRYPLFLDDLMASAAMDRLLHHAHVVVIECHSYRNPPGGRKVA